MFVENLGVVLFLCTLLSPFAAADPVEPDSLEQRAGKCTFAMKKAGIQYEIDTISSHTFHDANQIPLAPNASRTFYVTPNELGGNVTLPPINVGTTAESIRVQLVTLATFLNASVPGNHAQYIKNANGTVTSKFIQNDSIFLPHSHVSEVHEFNDACQITKITGYSYGNLICPQGDQPITNPTIGQLCKELKHAEGS